MNLGIGTRSQRKRGRIHSGSALLSAVLSVKQWLRMHRI